MTNLHIKHHGLAVNIIPVLYHGGAGGLGNESKEKGWFLHKTNQTNTLKDIAIEVLSGQNQCFPLQCVLKMIGFDDAIEFNSKVDASVHVKDGFSAYCETGYSSKC